MQEIILGTRVTTQKGKDMVRLVDGRWGTVVGEDESVLDIETSVLEYKDDLWYHERGIRFIPTEFTETYTIEKAHITDARSRCKGRR